MKYQIYLKKEASELINEMAKEIETTPAHLIKILLEDMTEAMKPTLEVIFNEIREATKGLTTNENR